MRCWWGFVNKKDPPCTPRPVQTTFCTQGFSRMQMNFMVIISAALKHSNLLHFSSILQLTELTNSQQYQCRLPAGKCSSECAKPPYYWISVFNSVICHNVYINGTKCPNLFTTTSLPSEVIVSTCLNGDGDLRSPTFGLKNRLQYL